jgi:hypothetical protein
MTVHGVHRIMRDKQEKRMTRSMNWVLVKIMRSNISCESRRPMDHKSCNASTASMVLRRSGLKSKCFEKDKVYWQAVT